MRRFFVRFNRSESFVHTRSLAGFTIVTSGFEFSIHTGKYRALVTDINLKGKMDGWEVARQARMIDPEFPIIYISGASAADWPSKGVSKSIMLSKPFAPAKLVTAVAQLLNGGMPKTT